VTVEAKRAFSLKDLVSEFPDHPSDWTISEAYICLLLSAAMADGALVSQEAEYLETIVELLEIVPEDAAMVTRVISIKNRY
jgi:uncharacterized tellurite resistance protein B-like protein